MNEHPVNQEILSIETDKEGFHYTVGNNGVTRIEATVKSGMHSHVPYIRVWKGETCLAEFCQHNIVGVYFKEG